MDAVRHPEPVADETPEAAALVGTSKASRLALLRKRQHEDEELDEALVESFLCSDPPASWAGP
jgi:hypothetical protein